ncbi:DUF4115 domain-containing protein [Colwellia sp. D2M02]|uniref:RodZ domain-containing protein n=1 Tax=Colwellia sp. D2M02 TaxID=2841562 RepID=UPI001C091CBE|nr:RodZ domain-containing protein [Colwellia sp. D2M02]MBU2893061.1 DUF4115 domain-containing protein [Colwellia sp. D2M02]
MNNNKRGDFSSEHVAEELSDDMIMVSPGTMLREAREKMSLTQADIATRLNFRIPLVESIEQDNLDPSLPVTFNRGYLSSYAKVVGVDINDVLASYDALGAAQAQRSEMQSFSKLTVKEAEHSRVMWFSYLIIAILVGLTVLWWLQESREPTQTTETPTTVSLTSNSESLSSEPEVVVSNEQTSNATEELNENESVKQKLAENSRDETSTEGEQVNTDIVSNPSEIELPSDHNKAPEVTSVTQPTSTENNIEVDVEVALAHAVFTFSGDCWVNIYDASGERVAWGVKKSGYIMTVEGKAPLQVTLGKPELASIVYNNEPIDMSAFNAGNIAKFTLPLSE